MATRRRYVAGWSIVAVATVHQLLLLLWPSGAEVTISAFIVTVTVLGTCANAIAAMRSHGRRRRMWQFAASGMASWAFAEIYDAVIEFQSDSPVDRPLFVHLANLGGLVLGIFGMLRIPSAPRTSPARVRMVLDGLVVGSSLLAIAWITILSPLRARMGSTSGAALELAYPILAVVVLAVALLVIAGQRQLRGTALSYIAGGMVTLTMTLLIEVFASVTDQGWLDSWVLTGLLLAAALLAAAPGGVLPPDDERAWEATTMVGRLMPYVPAAAMIAVSTVYLRNTVIEPPVMWSGVVMMCCLLGRQFLALQLTSSLTLRLERQREQFAYEAFHDRLTGLPNRAMLIDRLRQVDSGRGTGAALLMVDLDGFKAVNDTLGHGAGDDLLTVTAERLQDVTRRIAGDRAVAARLGGDEFAVLLFGGGLDLARTLAAALLDALSVPVALTTRTVTVRASVGVAVLSGTDGQPEHLLAEADIALYAAKASGKGCYRLFDAELSADALRRLKLQAELADALAHQQLEVAYQPIVDLPTGTVTGAEALVRWRHPERGLLAPDVFLPAALSMGMLADIDRWVLGTAAAQTAAWREQRPDMTISVNVSATYLTGGQLAGDVADVLARTGLPAAALTIEITETALVGDLDAAASTLAELRGLGARVALDDFGVGYSSLAYLRRLPVDTIKIDRSFVRDLADDSPDTTLVDAIVGLARSLGLDYIAEGVEDEAQAGRLHALECQRAQGYFFARPMPAAQLGALLDGSALAAGPVPAQR